MFVIKRDCKTDKKRAVWKACPSPTAKDGWSMEMRVTEGGKREGGTIASLTS